MEKIFLKIIIITSLITSLIGIILYLYKYFKHTNTICQAILISISLLILGVTSLIYILKYEDNNEEYNKYTILYTEDYNLLKNELEKDKKIIKEQNKLLSKLKYIINQK